MGISVRHAKAREQFKGGFTQYPFFVRTENAFAFFYVRMCKQYTHIRFFVVRKKAHSRILRTHRVEHGSAFVRFCTYQ